jgi:divalent metal cation (Fe/Co/Zn/Cd) transporter
MNCGKLCEFFLIIGFVITGSGVFLIRYFLGIIVNETVEFVLLVKLGVFILGVVCRRVVVEVVLRTKSALGSKLSQTNHRRD